MPLCIRYVLGFSANEEPSKLEICEEILIFDRQHGPRSSECTVDVEFRMPANCSKESYNSPTLSGLRRLLSK